MSNMPQYDSTYGAQQLRASDEARFLSAVYGWMTVGLVITAVVALFAATNQAVQDVVLGKPGVYFGLLIGEILLVLALSAGIARMSAGTATFVFLIYSAVNGLTLSIFFMIYELGSIGTTFLITAGTFGAMSLYGWTTKKDLTSLGSLCFMALIGIIIGTVVNFFVASTMLYWAITYIGIAIFIGLIAYDTQKIKMIGAHIGGADGSLVRKAAIMGALALYLDFINLLILLLRIFGRRR